MEAAPDMDCLLDELEEEVIASEALKENRIPKYTFEEVIKLPFTLPTLPSTIPTAENKPQAQPINKEQQSPKLEQSPVSSSAEDPVENSEVEEPIKEIQIEHSKLSPKHSLDTVVPIEETSKNSWLSEDTHAEIHFENHTVNPVKEIDSTEVEGEEGNSEYEEVLKYLDQCECEEITSTPEDVNEPTFDADLSVEEADSQSIVSSDSLLYAASTVAERIMEDVSSNIEELSRPVIEDETTALSTIETHESSIESVQDTTTTYLTEESETTETEMGITGVASDDSGLNESFSITADSHQRQPTDLNVGLIASNELSSYVETESNSCQVFNDLVSPNIPSNTDLPDSLAKDQQRSPGICFETDEQIIIEDNDAELYIATCPQNHDVADDTEDNTINNTVLLPDAQDSALNYENDNLDSLALEELPNLEILQAEDPEFDDSGNASENENEHSDVAPRNELTTVHVLPSDEMESEEGGHRLTECELMVGKVKPHWIPDSDCTCCMLCALKFSLLLRRHHCRACGRLLCAACCSERELLPYMMEAGKKAVPERVCMPCAIKLRRITEHEHRRDSMENDTQNVEDTNRRSVLKNNRVADEIVSEVDPGPSQGELLDRKRSVRFRDGVQPGSSTNGHSETEKSTAIKPKKKSRKRSSVVRRITELRIEDELTTALPSEVNEQYLVIKPNGALDTVDSDYCVSRLADGSAVSIILKKNLYCVIQIEKVVGSEHWCVSSRGFEFIGLDEIVFVWEKEEHGPITVPLNVLEKISEIFCSSFESEKSGVRPVAQRMPSLFSQPEANYPLTRHIYFFKPTCQKLPYNSLPSSSYLVACFVLDEELPWITAMPNRVLLSLGLQYGSYPTPIVNYPKRSPIVEMDPNNSIMKVFTDFKKWRYRISHVHGSTVSLSIDSSVIKIPRSAANEIKSIIDCNRSMIAWSCDINNLADSHLCCKEDDGLCQTHILSRESSTTLTGASFVVIDAGLKTSESGDAIVNMIEDGICIRMQSAAFQALIDNLTADVVRDFSLKTQSTELIIKWIDDFENTSDYVVKSDIDGLILESKYQYGLSLERAISSSLEFTSVPDSAVRLSHVYNLKDGRLAPVEEPRVFGVAELIARECTAYLDPYFQLLLSMNIRSMTVRIDANSESVEYTLSTWVGLEDEQAKFRQSMGDLIPILYNIMAYFPNGIKIEMKLSFVTTKSLPIKN